MIFGRRRKATAQEPTDPGPEETRQDDAEELAADADETAAAAEADDAGTDWAALDRSRNWREDGPFDITEVDLDADDIERIDLGALVITPHPGMELRLQVAQDTGKVVAAMVTVGQSALELAVFAAPRSGGLWAEIREEVLESTRRQQGRASLVEGPYGTELRRLVPVRTPDGQQGYQPSRTWAAEGPRWLLRGVVYGQAALVEDLTPPADQVHEIFAGCVVRRGEQAIAAGDVVAMTMPEGMTPRRPQQRAPQTPDGPPPGTGTATVG
ncbi:DUF3710 domain-containing protein [Desertihabitans brevis]|uniref:DUF3710 domain-containing protein n=1 Tax=Desertihabitans brevis TaxID=2268447 RepID=A0A367Z297_9ACTN|nr:DUF3710 domain-containing protein [Desertihabitans brevis]RCK71351.1 DUF3710 domain-containing protein [Desertihabitans brevis]